MSKIDTNGDVNGRSYPGREFGRAMQTVAQLIGPGDLTIITDYRGILGELIRKRLNNNQITDIFPGYDVNEIGLAIPNVI